MGPQNKERMDDKGSWRGKPPGLPEGIPPPSVPLSFLAASALGLIACGAAIVATRSHSVVDPTNDQVVGTAHLAMLATLSMGVLGAMHQFIPVISRHALRSTLLSRLTFAGWLAGAWLLALGFLIQRERLVESGGVFAGLAIVALVVNVTPALAQPGRGAPLVGLRLTVIGFVVTACFGVVYVLDRRENWFDLSGHVVLAHASIGLLAWLGLAYLSVSEKLWPMFMLAHVPGRRRSAWVAVVSVWCGVALLSPGLLFSLTWLAWCGAAVVTVGLSAHLFSLIAHVRHRRRTTDLHLVFVLTSAVSLVCAVGLALFGALVMPHHHHLGIDLVAATISALAGWLLIALVGHSFKIVPFILWSALRGRGISTSRLGTPLMFADLYHRAWARVVYALVATGVSITTAGFATASTSMLALGGGLLCATGITVALGLTWIPWRLFHAPATTGSDARPDPPSLPVSMNDRATF